jgi:anti-sigma factor RsiW
MSHEDWISDHLLGEETESDAAEAQRRLDTDPGLRDRVARLAQVAATLQRLSPAAWDTAAADPGKPVSAPARAPRARV